MSSNGHLDEINRRAMINVWKQTAQVVHEATCAKPVTKPPARAGRRRHWLFPTGSHQPRRAAASRVRRLLFGAQQRHRRLAYRPRSMGPRDARCTTGCVQAALWQTVRDLHDNLETVRRSLSIAGEVGARLALFEEGAGFFSMRFDPPARN
jgi:hypothetical protein